MLSAATTISDDEVADEGAAGDHIEHWASEFVRIWRTDWSVVS